MFKKPERATEQNISDFYKDLAKQGCKWPECKAKEQTQPFTLPIEDAKTGKRLEQQGQLLRTPVPFCEYHFYIVAAGNFTARLDKKKNKADLYGPFGIVSIVEAVIAAREMTKKAQPKRKRKE